MSILSDLRKSASQMTDDELREAIMDMRSRRRSSITERAAEVAKRKTAEPKAKKVMSREDILSLLAMLGEEETETTEMED